MIDKADADVMCEITYTDIKTGQPATDHIRAALAKGMSVTTTNKGPTALASQELMELAAANGARFLFEGTVMAGTPLLNLIRETLAGSEINEMQGILNGTTNFILTRMEGGMDYAAALDRGPGARLRRGRARRRCPRAGTRWPRSPSSPTPSSAPR